MNKNDQTCYMCEDLATSSEHVPQQCLFPKQKNLPNGTDLRKQLWTVPSCDKHNSNKSRDDEYFLYSIVMLINSNKVAQNQYFTKIKRAIKRKPSLFIKFANTMSPVNLHNSQTGTISKTYAFHLDEVRFNNIIDSLGRALYFKHFNTKWNNHIKYQAEYLIATLDSNKSHELNKPIQEISEQANGWFSNCNYYGENPQVFKYQVLEGKQSKIMRLHFYEGCRLLLFFL